MLGLFFALLALACQLAVGATVPAAAAQAVQPLAGFTIICHAGDGTSGLPNPPHQPAPDCQICLLCAAFATPVATLAASPLVPAPQTAALALAAPLPPSTAPLTVRLLAARPRGPPSLA
jgi:hypothetical protein